MSGGARNAEHTKGRLWLIPNTLDLGTWSGDAAPDLQAVLPLGAIRQAARLRYWVAENAKCARQLLKRVSTLEPLVCALQEMSIQELPRPPKGPTSASRAQGADRDIDVLLQPCLMGDDLGLVSDAGLPAVADPGAALVRAAHRHGVTVVPLSGPNSLVLAVAASGLNGQSFAFVGYLPSDAAPRTQRLRELEAHSRRWQQTQLMIETPYRNRALVQALLAGLQATTWLSISQGLTLASGWTRTLTVAQWRQADPRRLDDQLSGDVPAVFALLAA
jgi:16S rRNA (cytidine1402-2'-O)-methyltransferase